MADASQSSLLHRASVQETDPGSASPILFRGHSYTSSKSFHAGTHRARDPVETLESIRPYLQRAGVTRIADVTDLDTIGVPTTLALRPNAISIACSSGKGLTTEQAMVSGAMEACELHAAETASPPSFGAAINELKKIGFRVPPIDELPLTRWSLFNADWPIHWHLSWDLVNQTDIAVPLAVIVMSRSRSLISTFGGFQAGSNGLGAGNSFLEAISAGLYECIERDAIACHYNAALYRRHQIPILPRNVLESYPLVSSVLEKCDRAKVDVVVYDCTADTDVPTYSALVYNEREWGVGVMRGSGAHLDPEISILRAITEALQGRLNFIAGSRDDIFRAAFFRSRLDLSLTIQAIQREKAECPTASARASRAARTFEADLAELIRCVKKAGLTMVTVTDLTPPDCPVFVVRVFVPGFEGYMHHGYLAGKRGRTYLPCTGNTNDCNVVSRSDHQSR
jgi:ribosomal protein S12 methylthiotransferase accessory factor